MKFFEREDERLHVITTHFNPKGYKRREELTLEFIKYIQKEENVKLWVVLCTLGGSTQPRVQNISKDLAIIHVTTTSEAWMKENLVNVAVSLLPSKAKYMAWIDADLKFERSDWVKATIKELQNYQMVQMYSQIISLNPDGELLGGAGRSFMAGYKKAYELGKIVDKVCEYSDGVGSHLEWQGSPGGAWAARVSTMKELPLIDYVIMGSADYYMALALVGAFEEDKRVGYHSEYMKAILEWQEKALKVVNRNIGFLKGLLIHSWHGNFKDRGYDTRWKILVKNQFNPQTDIYYDYFGTLHIKDHKWRLRDDLRVYFSQRNEDSIG